MYWKMRLPMLWLSREAPTTARDLGRRRGRRELAAATRSRTSVRSRSAAAPSTGNSTWMLPPSKACLASNPELRNTPIIFWFSKSTSASKPT